MWEFQIHLMSNTRQFVPMSGVMLCGVRFDLNKRRKRGPSIHFQKTWKISAFNIWIAHPAANVAASSCDSATCLRRMIVMPVQRFKFYNYFFVGKYVELDIPWSLSLVMIAATASSSSAMYSSTRRRAKFFWTSSWKKVREKVKKKS